MSDETDLPTDPEILTIGGQSFARGQRGVVDFPLGSLINHQVVAMPVHVFRGRRPGPRLLVCAALHGDEINGIEVVRQLIGHKGLRRLTGDLIAVPVINVPAFLDRSRYLPDRRDLNRLFPGSPRGSLGARLAKAFLDEVALPCSHVIDLHTGAVNRPNLPHIRISPSCEGSRALAEAFHPPVVIESAAAQGTLREYLQRKGKAVLTFEGGQALQFDTHSVRVGIRGVISAMRWLGMLKERVGIEATVEKRTRKIVFSDETSWERAPRGGLFKALAQLGQAVSPGMRLGIVADPFSTGSTDVIATNPGVVIGRTDQCIVYEGDGVYHIAVAKNPGQAERRIQRHQEELDPEEDEPVFDEAMTD
jgi:predicted deacylase